MPAPVIRCRRGFDALHRLLTGRRPGISRDLPTASRLRRDIGLPEVEAPLRPSVLIPQAFASRNRA